MHSHVNIFLSFFFRFKWNFFNFFVLGFFSFKKVFFIFAFKNRVTGLYTDFLYSYFFKLKTFFFFFVFFFFFFRFFLLTKKWVFVGFWHVIQFMWYLLFNNTPLNNRSAQKFASINFLLNWSKCINLVFFGDYLGSNEKSINRN